MGQLIAISWLTILVIALTPSCASEPVRRHEPALAAAAELNPEQFDEENCRLGTDLVCRQLTAKLRERRDDATFQEQKSKRICNPDSENSACYGAIESWLLAGDIEKADELARLWKCTPKNQAWCPAEAINQLMIIAGIRKATAHLRSAVLRHRMARLEQECRDGLPGGCLALVYEFKPYRPDAEVGIQKIQPGQSTSQLEQDAPDPLVEDSHKQRVSEAVAGLTRRCAEAQADSCLGLALLYALEPSIRAPARSESILLSTCKSNECRQQAGLLFVKAGEGRRALRFFAPACQTGSVPACQALADWLIGGLPKEISFREVYRIFDQACNKGVGAACFGLGREIDQGWHDEANERRGAALVAKACKLEYEPACNYTPLRASEHRAAANSSDNMFVKILKEVGGLAVWPLLLPLCAFDSKGGGSACPLR